MKRKILNLSLFGFVGLVAFGAIGLSACNSSTGVVNFTPAKVNLDKQTAEIEVNKVIKLTASVSKGYSGSLRWFTSDSSVVHVENGYCYGIGQGTATVTASYGGGYADCTIKVTKSGGGEQEDKLLLSETNKTIEEGVTFKISHNVIPVDTVVTYTSSDTNYVTVQAVTGGAEITAVAPTPAGQPVTVTAVGSNQKTAKCTVTVTKKGDPTQRDIAVDSNLGYTGSLDIGSPGAQTDFMYECLADFNRLTNSSITFNVIKHEESDGTGNYPSADAMPAVFPYASDQTLSLNIFKALMRVGSTDKKWISDNMGSAAATAAKLGTDTVGYPFAADNGLVMFYNTNYITRQEAYNLTIDQLIERADPSKKLIINYAIGNGFYGGAALMTFNNGQSFYSLKAKNTGYSSEAKFNCVNGITGAKLVNKMGILSDVIRDANGAPTNKVVATIVDTSKVQSFKTILGDNYAVAPLPWVDETRTVRIATFLGYKFYGVNAQLKPEDQQKATAVAKFLCSEYVQAKRLEKFYVRPTLTCLESEAQNEPHISALIAQQQANSAIPLTACASDLWSQLATSITAIRTLSNPTDAQLQSILADLDKLLTKSA